MYYLIVKGARNATLAYHSCDSYTDMRDLLEVYRAMGYTPEALKVEERRRDEAA